MNVYILSKTEYKTIQKIQSTEYKTIQKIQSTEYKTIQKIQSTEYKIENASNLTENANRIEQKNKNRQNLFCTRKIAG